MRKEFIQLLEDNGFVVVEMEIKTGGNSGMDYFVLDGSNEEVRDMIKKYGKRCDYTNKAMIIYCNQKSIIKLHFRERNPEVYTALKDIPSSGLIDRDNLEKSILCKLYEMFEH